MKKSIIINIISWLGISLLLFFYLERQLAFHYFYIEQFRLFRFNQDYALQLFSHPGGISEYIASEIPPGWECLWPNSIRTRD